MKLSKASALDLKLQGSVGSFKVGASNNRATFEVKYLLTHVGLNFESGSDEKLLKELAPVREIFDFRSLDFDEIMQRDIDDSRVSGDLIPYILDEVSSDLVKFFPPIVVVALPLKSDANKPADYYPKVDTRKVERKDDPSEVVEWHEVQSGSVGQEVFKFEQPVVNGEVQLHNLVQLQVNTSKCKLVIVDGQHRAMALLALYRNLKDDWSDARRKPFESYYKEWTPDYIRSFNLKEIKLPMIICTIPELDESYRDSCGEYDLKKASRSIFLTLNKNARKVSRSRNLLLDDSDIVSSFMRRLLAKVKNGDKDFAASHSMEIHNVELDQSGDRQVICSPMAYTGVSHLYYVVEHLFLDSNDVKGVRKREGRFATRAKGTYFENALNRLDCENVLGVEALHNITRNVFSRLDENKLSQVFIDRYGNNFLRAMSLFYPFDAFARATQTTKNYAEKHADVHLKSMLFDGQGIARVFEEHRDSLNVKLKEGYFKRDVPKIESFKDSLDATYSCYKETISFFCSKLSEEYLKEMPLSKYGRRIEGDVEVDSEAVKLVSRLFDNVYKTVAFQAALVCGFYGEFERCSNQFQGNLSIALEDSFAEYLSQINSFFMPKSFEKFKSIVSLFFGEASGDDIKSLQIIENSKSTFRSVVFPGEMAPDEWPKYKYLLLEIWRPTNDEFESKLEDVREECREQILSSLYKRNIRQYCADKNRHESDLSHDDFENIYEKSFSDYKEMLRLIGKASALKNSLKNKIMAEI